MENNIFKIVLIGNSDVGKTTLLNYIVKNCFVKISGPTIGAGFSIKTIIYNNKKYKIHLWDTAGQERFRSISKLYYRNTHGCLCVFDITNKKSFDSIKEWIDDYREENNIKENIIFLIINKCDYDSIFWTVNESEIKKFCEENNLEFYYINCINGYNIEKMFNDFVTKIINNDYEKYFQKCESNRLLDLNNNLKSKFNCLC